ncbi:DUF3667 domain-containing protein [Zunongwangia sp.]|uniref:DUF3667 domain-containing protein n=1 Tax=Zunongwangia sp. TaxID=1965325 RepID=UPI003AA8DCFD
MNKKEIAFYKNYSCLNCHTPLRETDKFCPNCGQARIEKKLSFKDLLSELFSGLFAYDSRFIRTLRVLLFKPGKISKDYIEGKRMRYVNPYRFFLTTAIVFFLIYGFDSSLNIPNMSSNQQEVIQEIDSINTQNKVALQLEGLPTTQLDFLIKKPESKVKNYKDFLLSQEEIDSLTTTKSFLSKIKLFNLYFEETKNSFPEAALNELNIENSAYNRWLYKKVTDFNLLKQNPQLFVNYLIGKLPFIIFLFLPVFTLFISLLYLRSNYNYMEHLTFSFHTQSMCFMLYSLALTIDILSKSDIATNIAHIIFIGYLYKGLRNFYNQGRFKTLVKFILLNTIFFILAIIMGLLSLFGSFAFF